METFQFGQQIHYGVRYGTWNIGPRTILGWEKNLTWHNICKWVFGPSLCSMCLGEPKMIDHLFTTTYSQCLQSRFNLT